MAHELVLNRLLDATPEKLFRLWTDGSTYGEWFCPKPWTVSHAEMEVRAGGKSNVTMKGPNGEVVQNPGQWLEVIPNRKLVFSDAFVGDWVAKDGAPFMVATVTFTPEGDKTRYIATVSHWSEADRQQHENMGFAQGWGVVADQLEALARKI